ncbi:uncharacterized protein G2W53_033333 [Senna tora]|uniref:Uncharacterized protein n=1 Tax=Senna tora TaxID=362788 RepID=A0A834T206_9FABA|nr:uncharacterized protein G2W53_033333 [Senna tora]
MACNRVTTDEAAHLAMGKYMEALKDFK